LIFGIGGERIEEAFIEIGAIQRSSRHYLTSF